MAKLHTYYVANISTQTNYTYTNIDNENFYEELNRNLDDEMEFSNEEIEDLEVELDELNEFNEDEGEEENLDENNQEITDVGNEIVIENYLDLTDQELQRALEVEVRVVIEEEVVNYDHGSS
ncbi:2072_t:CDS:1 [Entrophospora sp. SA101]|nr:2072_t:CDS:1 [Entrophospora sp. SA101]